VLLTPVLSPVIRFQSGPLIRQRALPVILQETGTEQGSRSDRQQAKALLAEWGLDEQLWRKIDNKKALLRLAKRGEEDHARRKIQKLRDQLAGEGAGDVDGADEMEPRSSEQLSETATSPTDTAPIDGGTYEYEPTQGIF